MSSKISKALRHKVARRAFFTCEYCLFPEKYLATNFHVDHIRSLKHGGLTVLDNLAFTCPHCNQNKGSDIATFIDDNNEQTVRFFNPRKDVWHNTFEISNYLILGKTLVGIATVKILGFNEPDRVIFRKALIEAGIFPLKY